jgi:hypothetical protein
MPPEAQGAKKSENLASRDPPLKMYSAGSAALRPKTQRPKENQNHASRKDAKAQRNSKPSWGALSCEKPFN